MSLRRFCFASIPLYISRLLMKKDRCSVWKWLFIKVHVIRVQFCRVFIAFLYKLFCVTNSLTFTLFSCFRSMLYDALAIEETNTIGGVRNPLVVCTFFKQLRSYYYNLISVVVDASKIMLQRIKNVLYIYFGVCVYM